MVNGDDRVKADHVASAMKNCKAIIDDDDDDEAY